VVADAQGVRVSGTVERRRDGRRAPVAGALVVLHRMTAQDAGPVDSTRTDVTGRYRFELSAADSGRLVVTVRHDGVAYVSADAERRGATVSIPPLMVHDTSSTAPVVLAQRHVLVRGLDRDGSRAVLELLILRNAGELTRVGPRGDAATWRTRLLHGATEALVPGGQGDIGLEATRISGDTLAIAAPVPPGDRQLVVSYVVPASPRLALAVDGPVNQVTMMLADTAAVARRGLVPTGVMSFEGERYLRLEAEDVTAGDTLVVDLSPPPLRLEDLWWLIVIASAGVLAAAAFRWWRVPLAEPVGNL
jgi:hypothetical protein